MDPVFSQGFQMPAPQPSGGGMFGGGGNLQNIIMAAVSGLMARRNPQLSQTMAGMLHLRQQQAMQDEQYQHERSDRNADWKEHYDYELHNPKPVNNDTSADYSFWQSHLKPDQFEQWVQKQYDPDVSIPLPGGAMYIGPRSGMAAALGGGAASPATPPQAPVGKLRPLGAGGPSPSGSGGFL